jgi:hypothetical protein
MQALVLYVHMQAIVKAGSGATKDGNWKQESKNPLQLHGVTQGDAAGIPAL